MTDKKPDFDADQDIDLTALVGQAFETFTAERGLDADDADWPEKDQAAWDALVAKITANAE